MRCAIQFPVFHAHSPVNPECVSSWATAKDPTALRMQCGILRSAQNDMVMGRADPLIGPLRFYYAFSALSPASISALSARALPWIICGVPPPRP